MDFKLYVLQESLPFLMKGLLITLLYTSIAVILAIIWGLLIGTFMYEKIPVLGRVCSWYVTFFRETPLLVQMYVIFYGFPQIGITLSAPICAVLVLVLNDGSFLAEIFRGGLQSIEAGQSEASKSLGFSRLQTWWFFLLPQTLKKVLESVIGMISIILKDTSLLALITIGELTSAAQRINSKWFEPTTVFVTAAILYFLVFLVIEEIKKIIMKRQAYDYSRS